MKHNETNKWLTRLAVLTALATLCLIGLGGLVTSKEAGLAVPDWPTSYGSNMFLFPVDSWIGNIFYEHTHRLLASVVGLMTAGLAGWIWARETTGSMRTIGLVGIIATLGLMGVREPGMFIAIAALALGVMIYCGIQLYRAEYRLHWWAMIAFCAVLVQGVLGGLRVTMLKDEIGIFHGALAQMFLVLLCAIAVWTSRWWERAKTPEPVERPSRLKWVYATVAVMIFGQLLLGASMRHQHAGLAVPDFPRAHGQWWPATDAASIARYNEKRDAEVRAVEYSNPITAAHVSLHMAHRVMAGLVTAMVIFMLVRTRCELPAGHGLWRMAWGMTALIGAQAALGIFTVLKNKPADIATLHVVAGAVALAAITMMCLSAHRMLPAGKPREISSFVEAPAAAVN